MSAETIAKVVKMIENLPETAQEHVVEHLREYLEGMGDEARCDEAFNHSANQSALIAREARAEYRAGQIPYAEMNKNNIKSTVADLTIEQFTIIIQEVVEQTLLEVYGDPDEGLEVRDEFKVKIQQSLAETDFERIPVEEVASKLGLKW